MITREKFAEYVGRNVVAARKHMNVEPDKLADIADLHPNTVKRIEAGLSCPHSMTLGKIAAALFCEPGDLLPALEELKPGKRARLKAVA